MKLLQSEIETLTVSLFITSQVHLLRAYVTVQKFDIICLSGIYLDSSTPFEDDNLEIPDYNLIRSDNPSNNKGGGIFNYNFFLSLKLCDIN